jgi:hypothetical protein
MASVKNKNILKTNRVTVQGIAEQLKIKNL